MLGRDRDAQPELEHALHDAIAAGKPGVAYLAALFLGDLHEDAGNAADAAQYFAQATQLQPLAAGGWLALGRHRLSVGQADGWPSAAKVFASPTGLSVDPWYLYFTPFYDELAPRLSALRAMVRS
jgi:predicted Zn-dependent protease